MTTISRTIGEQVEGAQGKVFPAAFDVRYSTGHWRGFKAPSTPSTWISANFEAESVETGTKFGTPSRDPDRECL